jgi:hypothetical protein
MHGLEAVVTFLRDETSGILTLLPAPPTPSSINVCRKPSVSNRRRRFYMAFAPMVWRYIPSMLRPGR